MLPFAAFGQRASIARLRRSKPSSNHRGVDLISDALAFAVYTYIWRMLSTDFVMTFCAYRIIVFQFA